MGILKNDGEEIKVENGEGFIEQAKDIDVPFSCEDGICGSCLCTVASGGEFLSPKSEAEDDWEVGDDERLICQCKFIGGDDDVVEVEVG
jgi:ferredoxin